MIKIKYNNNNVFHEVEFSKIENTATLKRLTEENANDFTTWKLGGKTRLSNF